MGITQGQEIATRKWAGCPGIGAPLGTAHGCPPDSTDLYILGSIISEKAFTGPKALVHTCQVWMPVLDESAGAHIDPRPDPGAIHTEQDIYFGCQLRSRGNKYLSYRVQKASRLSPNAFLFPLFPSGYHHLTSSRPMKE